MVVIFEVCTNVFGSLRKNSLIILWAAWLSSPAEGGVAGATGILFGNGHIHQLLSSLLYIICVFLPSTRLMRALVKGVALSRGSSSRVRARQFLPLAGSSPCNAGFGSAFGGIVRVSTYALHCRASTRHKAGMSPRVRVDIPMTMNRIRISVSDCINIKISTHFRDAWH